MSKKQKSQIPAGLPAVAAPEVVPENELDIVPVITEEETESQIEPVIAEEKIVTEKEYQIEQETVTIEAVCCPRCGSTERTPLKEISPRLYIDRGCVIRYRTKCLGRITPIDSDGKPLIDSEGKPVSYECGNRYKVKKIVPRAEKK